MIKLTSMIKVETRGSILPVAYLRSKIKVKVLAIT